MKDTIEHEVFDGSKSPPHDDFDAARGLVLGIVIGACGWGVVALLFWYVVAPIWRMLAQ